MLRVRAADCQSLIGDQALPSTRGRERDDHIDTQGRESSTCPVPCWQSDQCHCNGHYGGIIQKVMEDGLTAVLNNSLHKYTVSG